MNAKTSKLIRRLCDKLDLNYHRQKKVFESLSKKDQDKYIADAKGHLGLVQLTAGEKYFKNVTSKMGTQDVSHNG